jgi:hypothetical protein
VGIDTAGVSRLADERPQAATVSPEPPDLTFFDAVRDVVLFCRDTTGRPIGYPMRTTACEPEALVFTTYRKSAKVRHIERDPRVPEGMTDFVKQRLREGKRVFVRVEDLVAGQPGRSSAVGFGG